jgi:hypothetical protein
LGIEDSKKRNRMMRNQIELSRSMSIYYSVCNSV